jgi:hypothetical protein
MGAFLLQDSANGMAPAILFSTKVICISWMLLRSLGRFMLREFYKYDLKQPQLRGIILGGRKKVNFALSLFSCITAFLVGTVMAPILNPSPAESSD